jgi:membrane-associated phospholipid phosphatase
MHFIKRQEYIILFIIFISTYILPILLLLFLKKMNLIKDYHLRSIRERKFPVLFFVVLSFLIGRMLLNIQIVNLLAFSFFGVAVALSFTYLLFNFNIKSSLHTLGMGGLVGFVIIMSFEYQLNFNLIIAILFVLSGLIAVSRIKLKAHYQKEVYIGFLLGIMSQIISFQVYHNI